MSVARSDAKKVLNREERSTVKPKKKSATKKKKERFVELLVEKFAEQFGDQGINISKLVVDETLAQVVHELVVQLLTTKQSLPVQFFELLPSLVIVELAKHGLTHSEIARRMDCSTRAIHEQLSKAGQNLRMKRKKQQLVEKIQTPETSHVIHIFERVPLPGPGTSKVLHRALQEKLKTLDWELTEKRIEAIVMDLQNNGFISYTEGAWHVIKGHPPEPELRSEINALKTNFYAQYFLNQQALGARHQTFAKECQISIDGANRFRERILQERPAGSFLDQFNLRSNKLFDAPTGYTFGLAIKFSEQLSPCDPIDHVRNTPLNESLFYNLATISPSLFDDVFDELPNLEHQYQQILLAESKSLDAEPLKTSRYQLSVVAVVLPGNTRF